MKISNVVIFAAGRCNNKDYGIEDLDALVTSFVGLHNAGRIPLKIGHDSKKPLPDGQPAYGWCVRLARDGLRLVADFDDVPDAVVELIRKKAYRYISVEMFRDAKDPTGKRWPLVLDAIALLGADRPGCEGVSDLSALIPAQRQRPVLEAAERMTLGPPDGAQVREELRQHAQEVAAVVKDVMASSQAEVQQLRAQLIASKFEMAIRERKALPRDRELFRQHFGNAGTVADAEMWLAATRPPATVRGAATRPNDPDAGPFDAARADHVLVERTRGHMRERWRQDAVRLTFSEAAAEVVRLEANHDLLAEWVFLPGEKNG